MFRLPDETKKPGFLPSDVKEGHTTSEPVPISNVNEPEAVWFEQASMGSSRDGSDRYYVELTDSDQWLEASCFVQKSTIPGAGLGLFIKPHPPIPKRQFVCFYATHSTTEEAMEAASSSRDYAIMAEKGKVWFDAEKYDRYTSAGLQTKCMCTSPCWKLPNAVERPISTKCERQIGRGSTMWTPKEQPWCTSNGKDRWSSSQQKTCRAGPQVVLPLIRRNQDRFPENMTSIISWFLHSDECNWTKEQKEKWLGL